MVHTCRHTHVERLYIYRYTHIKYKNRPGNSCAHAYRQKLCHSAIPFLCCTYIYKHISTKHRTNNAYKHTDIFAQFFVSPLLRDDSTVREVKAVENEHIKNLQSDGWRAQQVGAVCECYPYVDRTRLCTYICMCMINNVHCDEWQA